MNSFWWFNPILSKWIYLYLIKLDFNWSTDGVKLIYSELNTTDDYDWNEWVEDGIVTPLKEKGRFWMYQVIQWYR